MKEQLQQLAAYHIWANNRLFGRISQLTEEQVHREVASSFPSLYQTILHMWDAESIWWQRFRLAEHITRPSEHFKGNIEALISSVNAQSQQWKAWIDEARLIQLEHVFAYQNMKKEQFKQPLYQVLLHIFNHGTYHRGQLVTLLHQVGADKIPSTDFVEFTRTVKN